MLNWWHCARLGSVQKFFNLTFYINVLWFPLIIKQRVIEEIITFLRNNFFFCHFDLIECQFMLQINRIFPNIRRFIDWNHSNWILVHQKSAGGARARILIWKLKGHWGTLHFRFQLFGALNFFSRFLWIYVILLKLDLLLYLAGGVDKIKFDLLLGRGKDIRWW